MLKSEALYELGRYKKKVDEQTEEIQKLKDSIEGHEQLQQMNNALVAILLTMTGPTEIKREDIGKAMEKYTVMAEPTEEGFRLRTEGEGNATY